MTPDLQALPEAPPAGREAGASRTPVAALALFWTATFAAAGVAVSLGTGRGTVSSLAFLALALLLEFGVAAAFFPALGLERPVRTWLLLGATGVIAPIPLLIPADAPLPRCLGAIGGALLLMKVYDSHVSAGRGVRPDKRTYLLWLPNFFSVVLGKLHLEPVWSRRDDLPVLLGGAAGTVASLVLLFWARGADWSGTPFLLEHGTKALVVFAAFTFSMNALGRTVRMAGAPTRDFARAPWLARTPADFWRRYNRVIHQFLDEHAFRPGRRLGSPALGLLAAFLLSGILHEYIFTVAVGRVQGYQMAFFTVQGLAVVVTARLKPRGWLAVPATLATFLFMLVSSVLFFASMHGVTPLYARDLPWWMGW